MKALCTVLLPWNAYHFDAIDFRKDRPWADTGGAADLPVLYLHPYVSHVSPAVSFDQVVDPFPSKTSSDFTFCRFPSGYISLAHLIDAVLTICNLS